MFISYFIFPDCVYKAFKFFYIILQSFSYSIHLQAANYMEERYSALRENGVNRQDNPAFVLYQESTPLVDALDVALSEDTLPYIAAIMPQEVTWQMRISWPYEELD